MRPLRSSSSMRLRYFRVLAEFFLFPQPIHYPELIGRRSFEIGSLRNDRQHIFAVLVHFHRVVIKKPTLVVVELQVGVENIDEVSHARFDDKGENNLHRAPVFAHQFVNVVLVVALLQHQLTFFGDVKILGIELLTTEFPESF